MFPHFYHELLNWHASNAATSQFASFLVWKVKNEIGADAAPGSIEFSQEQKAVIFVSTATAIGKAAYVDLATGAAPLIPGVVCKSTESAELWAGGVAALVSKHQAAISQAVTNDIKVRDSKRLQITDADPKVAARASPRSAHRDLSGTFAIG